MSKPKRQKRNPASAPEPSPTYTEADLHEAELAHSRAQREFERRSVAAQQAQQRGQEARLVAARAMAKVEEIEAALAEQAEEPAPETLPE